MVFQTAVLGFRKKDVLACIDRLTAESLEQQKQAQQRIEELQGSLDHSQSECVLLKEEAKETLQQIVMLEKKNAEQEELIQTAKALAEKQNDQMKELETQNQDYKRRLFDKEAENVCLHRDLHQLTQECNKKQVQLEDQKHEIERLKQDCQRRLAEADDTAQARMEQVRKEAADQLVQVQNDADHRVAQVQAEVENAQRTAQQQVEHAQKQAAKDVAQAKAYANQEMGELRRKTAEQIAHTEKQAQEQVAQAQAEADQARHAARREEETAKARISAGAANIGTSLTSVRQDLAAVEQNILQLSQDLQHSIASLERALDQTESDVKALNTRVLRFPDVERPARPDAPKRSEDVSASKPQEPKTPKMRVEPHVQPTLSEMLLDKLVQLMNK